MTILNKLNIRPTMLLRSSSPTLHMLSNPVMMVWLQAGCWYPSTGSHRSLTNCVLLFRLAAAYNDTMYEAQAGTRLGEAVTE